MDSLEENFYASARPLNARPDTPTAHDKIPRGRNMILKSPIKRLSKDIGVGVSTEVGGPISITIMWDVTPCSLDRYVDPTFWK